MPELSAALRTSRNSWRPGYERLDSCLLLFAAGFWIAADPILVLTVVLALVLLALLGGSWWLGRGRKDGAP